MKISRLLLFVIVPVLFLASCKLSINESIFINGSETTRGSKNTINGIINIGENADVKGECRSINGNIDVGSNSKVRDLMTVNGNITVGKETQVKGDIKLINGHVKCEPGVKVTGCVETINGRIILDGTYVEDDISTYNGNIELSDKSIAGEDIIINEKHGNHSDYHEIKIEIDNSTVEGDIINEDPDTKVTVYLKNGGKVKGKIIDAKVVEK